MWKQILRVTLLWGAIFCSTSQADPIPILSLHPLGGAIGGLPGSVIGWGFTITNNTNWLVVTSSEFTPGTPLGAYTDFSAFNFIVVGPSPDSTVVSQPFDLGTLAGIGSFFINPGAPAGAIAWGSIVLTYDLFARSPNDPSFNPDFDTISVGNVLRADASVEVVPEPSTLLLLGSGLIGLGRAAAKRRKRNETSRRAQAPATYARGCGRRNDFQRLIC